MKSLNPSLVGLRRGFMAAAVVMSIGTAAVLAQSSSAEGSSSNSTSSDNSSTSSNMSANNSANSGQSMNGSSDTSSSNASNSSNTSDKLSWSERHFVEKAAKGGMSEVALGQLASQQASNPDVKSYGETLVRDHQMANSQLMQIAQQKNVKMDKDEDGKDHFYKSLSKKSGTDFDREFVDHEVKDHKKDVKEFEKMAQDAKDPDLKNFAAQTLPKLREHLATAQRLQQSIEATGHPSGFNSSNSSSDSTSSSSTSTGATSESSSLSGTSSNSTGMSSGTSSTSTSSTR